MNLIKRDSKNKEPKSMISLRMNAGKTDFKKLKKLGKAVCKHMQCAVNFPKPPETLNQIDAAA